MYLVSVQRTTKLRQSAIPMVELGLSDRSCRSCERTCHMDLASVNANLWIIFVRLTQELYSSDVSLSPGTNLSSIGNWSVIRTTPQKGRTLA